MIRYLHNLFDLGVQLRRYCSMPKRILYIGDCQTAHQQMKDGQKSSTLLLSVLHTSTDAWFISPKNKKKEHKHTQAHRHTGTQAHRHTERRGHRHTVYKYIGHREDGLCQEKRRANRASGQTPGQARSREKSRSRALTTQPRALFPYSPSLAPISQTGYLW